jgi:phosphatidylglycerophosphatase A
VAVKESSDELNSAVVTIEVGVPPPRPARSAKDYLALAIATCGVGYIPVASGTFGSLVGVALYFLLRGLFLRLLFPLAARNHLNLLHIGYGLVTLELVSIFCVYMIGTWAASRSETIFGKKDPGRVVIDEVAGQLVALAPIPMVIESWWTVVLAFLLFRLFDIIKPYPAWKLESLKSGLGIMADDIVAGAYAAVIVALVVAGRWFI